MMSVRYEEGCSIGSGGLIDGGSSSHQCSAKVGSVYERDERRMTAMALVVEGRVVDGVYRVWMQGGTVIILRLCCRGCWFYHHHTLFHGRGTLTSVVINGPL